MIVENLNKGGAGSGVLSKAGSGELMELVPRMQERKEDLIKFLVARW